MTIVAMEGMASEACDRERMYLDVLGSRDLMSKKPFSRQTECKTPQTHEPDYNIGLAETTTLMRVPLPLCPPAPRPFPTTPCATHAALDTQSSTRRCTPVRRRTHRSLSQTLISNLSLLAPISLSKRKYRIISQQTTLTPRIISNKLCSLSPKATFQTNTKTTRLLC